MLRGLGGYARPYSRLTRQLQRWRDVYEPTGELRVDR